MSLETQGIKLFWRDIPGFCRDILEAPEKFEKKMFGFNSRPLKGLQSLMQLAGTTVSRRSLKNLSLVPPPCALPQDYLSDTHISRGMGFWVCSSTTRARYHTKTRQKVCDTPSALLSQKGIARYWEYLALGRKNRRDELPQGGFCCILGT